jgi:YVTN family beta-propeller protein
MRGVLAMFLVLAAVDSGVAAADLLVVLNKSDHEAVLVDPISLKTLTKVATGHGPHEAAVSPDGRRAYVCNYGLTGVFREGERRDEPGNTLSVLDLESRAVVDTFDLGEFTRPHGIAVSRDGKRLWLTCEGAQAVLELDAASGKILRDWKTGQEVSHMLVPTPDEKKLYVANIRSGSASVVDRERNTVKTVVTGAGAEGIDVTRDGRQVWVTNRAAQTVSVIDTSSDSVIASFESGGEMPIRVKFTPDGKEAWISNARSNAISVFDAGTRKQLASIPVGAVPIGIQMSPDGKRAFVANTNDDRITVLDVPRRKVVTTFGTGNEPDGMAWAVRAKVKRP